MPLPTGIVTFLFTDIEGSTRMVSDHRDTYREVLALHRAIIGEEAAAAGGVLVGTEGDACFLVFDRPSSALEAAVATQLRFAETPWPDSVAPKIRIGIHTGEAAVENGQYVGLAVHVAARVAAAGHGGQIVATTAALDLSEAGDWTTQDLGLHRLKDIGKPVGLHQIGADGLDDSFPALRSHRSTPHLRVPMTSLVGRVEETAAVVGLLATNPLVTLLGPGGIGKTRLALNVAAVAGAQHPDGVWFVDLTAADSAGDVPATIASALGLSPPEGIDPTPAIVEYLADRSALVILDNFEHVVDAAPIVSVIAEQTEAVTLLVTSRERLRVQGEHPFDVPPLSLGDHSDAVSLFMDRARALRPGIDDDPAEHRAVVQICDKLDGLPLAIELAASHVRLFAPTALLERLESRLETLTGGGRDLHRRQRTIRDTIEWSHNLLTDAERDVFAQLPIFRTPRRIEAVESVVAGEVFEPLAGLIDKSLVQQRTDEQGTERLVLLELVREYAQEHLADRADRRELMARHASFYADWLSEISVEIFRGVPDTWTRRIDLEFADIDQAYAWAFEQDPTTAVRIAASLGYYFHRGGSPRLAYSWLAPLETTHVDDRLAGYRDVSLGLAAFGIRNIGSAHRLFGQGMDLAKRSGDGPLLAWSTMNLGACAIGQPAMYDTGYAEVEEATALAGRLGLPVLEAQGYNILGELARNVGDDALAEEVYTRSLEIAQAAGDDQREAMMHGNMIFIANHRNRVDEAIEQARQAVAIYMQHRHWHHVALIGAAVAHAVASSGDGESAAKLLGSSDAACERMQLEVMVADVGEGEAARAHVKSVTGPDFEAWYAAGRNLPLSDAFELAFTKHAAAVS